VAAVLLDQVDQQSLVLLVPISLVDIRLQVVDPSFPALLATAPKVGDQLSQCHCDCGPGIRAHLCGQLHQPLVLLLRPDSPFHRLIYFMVSPL
jgi:hypothetical protein